MSEREQHRREIDAVLAEDARRFPAFAEARRAALGAFVEAFAECNAASTRDLLGQLHRYEGLRAGETTPRSLALIGWTTAAGGWCAVLRAYERARASKPAPVVAPPIDPSARARAIRKAFPAEQSIAALFVLREGT